MLGTMNSLGSDRMIEESYITFVIRQLRQHLISPAIVHNCHMERKSAPRHPVTCEFEGQTHKGTYWVAGKIPTVATGGGGRSKQVGTMEPQELAKQLLLELVRKFKCYRCDKTYLLFLGILFRVRE